MKRKYIKIVALLLLVVISIISVQQLFGFAEESVISESQDTEYLINEDNDSFVGNNITPGDNGVTSQDPDGSYGNNSFVLEPTDATPKVLDSSLNKNASTFSAESESPNRNNNSDCTLGHTYDQTYSYNGSAGHYQVCTVCGRKNSTISHSLETIVTPSAHSQQCNVCGYTTASRSHTWGRWINHTSTQHKHSCTFRDCDYTEYEDHIWGMTNFSRGASGHYNGCTAYGCAAKSETSPHTLETISTELYHYQKCTDNCGYRATYTRHTWEESGSNHVCRESGCTASHSINWGSYRTTGSNGHSMMCTYIGCTIKSDTVPHELTTISTALTHYQKCSSNCGYVKTPVGHAWSSWSDDSSTQHSRTCTNSDCGYTAYSNHRYGSWSKYSSTEHRKYCSTCGNYQYESHNWKTEGSKQVCTTCNYKA